MASVIMQKWKMPQPISSSTILGKGVYVLEHSYRIARGGTYETGLATIQCAYAPEYASHSAGGIIVIK
ncbi:hypothetical protein LEA_12128 [human gut metagenome]|uniref:Uncharacterized protein n=1 Tax=human gut metagenome TaxID=408170 RepID=K1SMJ6_9ZZZZ